MSAAVQYRDFSGEVTYEEIAAVVSSIMDQDLHKPGHALSADASHLATIMGEMNFSRQNIVTLLSLDERSLGLLRKYHEQARQVALPLTASEGSRETLGENKNEIG